MFYTVQEYCGTQELKLRSDMEVYILDSNYHDISYGFETKVMRILLAECHMHQCTGQTRRRFHGHFRSSCPIIFPPATPSYTKFFPPVTVYKQQFLHCSYGNSAFGYQPRMLPGASDVTLIRTQTASSPVVLLLLPASGILLPCSCHCCAVFRAFLSATNILSNAVLAFVVVTSASALLSLLAVTLSPVGSAIERSSEWTVFRYGHFLCVKEGPSRYAS